MPTEQLRSAQCPKPEIVKKLIREESPAEDQPPYVVALTLRCEYAERRICPLSNRLVGRGGSEEEATTNAMQAVDREIPRGCLMEQERHTRN